MITTHKTEVFATVDGKKVRRRKRTRKKNK